MAEKLVCFLDSVDTFFYLLFLHFFLLRFEHVVYVLFFSLSFPFNHLSLFGSRLKSPNN